MNTKQFVCPGCKRNRVDEQGHLCKACYFKMRVHDMMQEDPDYQDWEFAVCGCCGSGLWDDGECHNTSCGCSPHQGEDWL